MAIIWLDHPTSIKNDIPLLADFGLARNLDLTQSETITGTTWYNPPEWIEVYLTRKGSEHANYKRTEQDDLWAVGVIFQELLTGIRPFATITDILNCERVALSPDLPYKGSGKMTVKN